MVAEIDVVYPLGSKPGGPSVLAYIVAGVSAATVFTKAALTASGS